MGGSKPYPPLLANYAQLVCRSGEAVNHDAGKKTTDNEQVVMVECELPVIDLGGLKYGSEAKEVAAAICKASSEWGFFQVVNHGISHDLLKMMREEQKKVFESSFEKKSTCGFLNNSYRWGNHAATNTTQLSWSEAFHVPLIKIAEESCYGEFTSLGEVMGEYASEMQKLARKLAEVLVTSIEDGELNNIYCDESSCFLRLNHYPVCTVSPDVHGLIPHTDTDFLTVLHQDDEVGGLQLKKDSKWVAVKPNKDALIVNIGDLFQAWSNDVYKSVEHRVMVNPKVERYSIAFFLCPSDDSVIGSLKEPSVYKKFTFEEYRRQTHEDVKNTGTKIGLPRFLN